MLEINVFNEDPLAVSEVTTYIGTVEEARREVEKVYGRRCELKLLTIANAPSEVVDELRRLAETHRKVGVWERAFSVA